VKNKTRLLLAMMEDLAGDAHISFEGDLSDLRLSTFPGATAAETVTLKRNTLRPLQDFLCIPLEAAQMNAILSAVGGTVPRKILHIQIEKAGALEFGAYDNFHPECIYFGRAVRQVLIDSLQAQGVLKSVPKGVNVR